MRVSLLVGLLGCFLAASGHAATINFSGALRSEAASYNNLGLGVGGNISKNFIATRMLLNPNLVVDDHFSIKSQWSLLSSPNFTPRANQALGMGQGAYVFGDPNSSAFLLSRAWLEWTSDIGVFRLGRMPVSWGYGVLYDAGDGMWDDFQSTYDRLEYRLHLGYVVGALAYSKGRKISVLGNDDDQEFYAVYLRYDNPESEVEAGLLFEKQQRTGVQQDALMTEVNPHAHPASTTHLSQRMPYPLSNNAVDVYLKKTAGHFSYGGEVSWIQGTSTDYGNNGGPNGGKDDMNAFAVLLNVAFDYRKVKSFLEVMYASGDTDINNNTLTGFVLLHPNRRPGLILGRHLLGPYHGNHVDLGSPVAYGNNGTFSGVFYLRPGARIEWSPSLSSAIEVIIAQKAAAQAGEAAHLGVELDVGTEYAIYKNFKLGLDVGILIPGAGLQTPSPSAPFAIRTTAALTF